MLSPPIQEAIIEIVPECSQARSQTAAFHLSGKLKLSACILQDHFMQVFIGVNANKFCAELSYPCVLTSRVRPYEMQPLTPFCPCCQSRNTHFVDNSQAGIKSVLGGDGRPKQSTRTCKFYMYAKSGKRWHAVWTHKMHRRIYDMRKGEISWQIQPHINLICAHVICVPGFSRIRSQWRYKRLKGRWIGRITSNMCIAVTITVIMGAIEGCVNTGFQGRAGH